jgi:hypothetical protein
MSMGRGGKSLKKIDADGNNERFLDARTQDFHGNHG